MTEAQRARARRLHRAVGIAICLAAGLLLLLVPTRTPRERPEDAVKPPPTEEDYAKDRRRMVDDATMRYGLSSPAVLAAMRDTPRHLFVPERSRPYAYDDYPLAIGGGQTISAPGLVAKMTELLDPEPEDVILEVGTGSGYQAAVLAGVVKHVYTIEIVPALAKESEERLRGLGYANITVRCGDGYRGWPEHAPFDGIIVTCAPEDIPQPLQDQLVEGGRMVIPVGPEESIQWLYVLTKRDGKITRDVGLSVRFVPMTGEAQRR